MGPSKIILIGVLVQLAAVISSVLAPRIQKKLLLSNQKLLLWVVLLAEIIPIYACLGLILPFGGLRTEGEMYVAATWFGLVSFRTLHVTGRQLSNSYTVLSTAIVEQSMPS
jgi:UMF1 family MFS transporter